MAFQRVSAGGSTWTTIGTDTVSPYSASFVTTAVPDGLYDLRVVATDQVGNTTTSGPITDRVVDNTPPTVALTDGPAEGSSQASGAATLTFVSSEPGVAFQCQLDGVAYSGCPSTKTYSGLGDGAHTFGVRAIDPAGNSALRRFARGRSRFPPPGWRC